MRCPLRYYYEKVLGFSRHSEDTPFLRFHRYLNGLLAWIQDQHTQTGSIELSAVLEQVENTWVTTGLTDHPFESIYRKNSESMAARALQVFSKGRKITKSEPIHIQLNNGIVVFKPDHIEINDASQRILRRMRTGRVSSTEADQDVYGLYYLAAKELAGNAFQVEVFSMTNGNTQVITLSERKIESRKSVYDRAMAGILAKQFPPEPKNSRQCPRCPNYFICPTMVIN